MRRSADVEDALLLCKRAAAAEWWVFEVQAEIRIVSDHVLDQTVLIVSIGSKWTQNQGMLPERLLSTTNIGKLAVIPIVVRGVRRNLVRAARMLVDSTRLGNAFH